jgi:hypothetical protein
LGKPLGPKGLAAARSEHEALRTEHRELLEAQSALQGDIDRLLEQHKRLMSEVRAPAPWFEATLQIPHRRHRCNSDLYHQKSDRTRGYYQGLGKGSYAFASGKLMANQFALLVQQRPMTAEEEPDERKAAAALQHSPMVAKYMPGAGPRIVRFGKPSRPGKAAKSLQEWTKRDRSARERKRLPHAARSENIEGYIRARRRAYSDD